MTTSSLPFDWTAQGVHQVSTGVFRLALPLAPNDGLKAVNVYVLESDDGLVLVDGGWSLGESRQLLDRCLAELGHSVHDISRFLVTHFHVDHYTQAVAIRQETGSIVYLGAEDRANVEEAMNPDPLGSRMLEQLRAAGAEDVIEAMIDEGFGSGRHAALWELPDRWLRGGERIQVTADRELVSVHTPGHTRGHHVFADANSGLLFSGDHVLPHITPSIGVEAVSGRLPLLDYLDSLHKVRAMPDMAMLPAHGAPSASVHERVDELLLHHDERLAACLANLGTRQATAYEVAQRMSWTGRNRKFTELNSFNQMLAICETAAHLDVLVHRGRLNRIEPETGPVSYAP